MIYSGEMEAWLRHRMGERRTDTIRRKVITKALELNRTGPDFIDIFGRKEFRAFVGFIDIIEFSSRNEGRTPAEIANYLCPF